MGGIEGLGIESCLIRTRNDENNVRHWQQISSCEANNWGINQADLR